MPSKNCLVDSSSWLVHRLYSSTWFATLPCTIDECMVKAYILCYPCETSYTCPPKTCMFSGRKSNRPFLTSALQMATCRYSRDLNQTKPLAAAKSAHPSADKCMQACWSLCLRRAHKDLKFKSKTHHKVFCLAFTMASLQILPCDFTALKSISTLIPAGISGCKTGIWVISAACTLWTPACY